MSSPTTPIDGIDLPPASIQDENTSPTNDPLIPKHLKLSAEKRNATPLHHQGVFYIADRCQGQDAVVHWGARRG